MVIELLDRIMHADCWFKRRFHIYCPGCGGTRALKALIKLNLWQSLCYNPIAFLFVITELTVVLSYILEKRNKMDSLCKFRIEIRIGLLVLWFVFFSVRNLLLKSGIDALGDF